MYQSAGQYSSLWWWHFMQTASALSLCLIARDSARTLSACLASICPWVDDMVVVDTGSHDETMSIAHQFGARVFEFPWRDDFSAARNESLRHALGDWVFWMDSDDTISPENGLRLRHVGAQRIDASPIAYVMQVHCPGPAGSSDVTVVDHVKLFRNDPRLRFEGRIHEQILPAIRRVGGDVGWTDIFVTHSGVEHSAEARLRKQIRDLKLLELELAEKPAHPFVLFNLGMTYADMDRPEIAGEFLKRCLKVSSSDESHVRKAYALLVGCLLQLQSDTEARRVAARSLELFPHDPELSFRMGVIEQRARNFDVAINFYRSALAESSDRHFSSRDRGITGHKARHNMATAYRELRRLDLAELQWRLALESEPNYVDGWRGLVEALLEQGKLTTLSVELDNSQLSSLPKYEVACARARLIAKQGSIGEAIHLLDAAMAEDGETVEPLRVKCQLLFEHSDPFEAISALEGLCRRIPEDGAAWHNLGVAHWNAQQGVQAMECLERSLRVRPGCSVTQELLEQIRFVFGQSLSSSESSDVSSLVPKGEPIHSMP